MEAFVIDGGRRLKGAVPVSGAKNAALPLMAAALLTDDPVTLSDVPLLRDISSMQSVLADVGCTSERLADGSLRLQVTDPKPCHARYELVRTMRASICVLGPLLAKRGRARVSMPGGCAIGDRPVDLHLRGLAALGARITLHGGDITAEASRLQGTTIFLGGPMGSTVLGTANVMSAATLAEGVTVIESAACEPEVVDLADLLNRMGAHISGAGTPRITIEGVKSLSGAKHRIIADRIEAGTYAIAGALTNGELTVENFPYDNLLALIDRLTEIGVEVDRLPGSTDRNRCRVAIHSRRRLAPVQVTTQPFPGFPTDLQAQLLALLCLADGNSVVTERIYPERFLHVAELGRMGANIFRQGPTVIISGVPHLIGAPVMASDLRASACLVLAGLAAQGRTVINRVYHLDRGYEGMEKKLNACGASIQRVDAEDAPTS